MQEDQNIGTEATSWPDVKDTTLLTVWEPGHKTLIKIPADGKSVEIDWPEVEKAAKVAQQQMSEGNIEHWSAMALLAHLIKKDLESSL